MGFTHSQLQRILANVADGRPFHTKGTQTVIEIGEGRTVTVVMGPEQIRKIASITLPQTTVQFEFTGYEDTEAETEMDKIARHFHKGGG